MGTYREIQRAEKQDTVVAIVGIILSMVAMCIFFYALLSLAGLLHNLLGI